MEAGELLDRMREVVAKLLDRAERAEARVRQLERENLDLLDEVNELRTKGAAR